MVGMALAKSMYAIPTWTRTARTRKGGGYYGYKVHAAVDTLTGLPVAWEVQTASAAETTVALPLLDAVKAAGFDVRNAIADKGYDNGPFHNG